MICSSCQTTLPDEAIACWKCGKPLAPSVAAPASTSKPRKKKPIDPIVAFLTLIGSTVFFGCIGWSVPFTVWGKLNNAAADFPQWAQFLGAISTIAGVVAALITFVGIWWLSAWLITRVMRPD